MYKLLLLLNWIDLLGLFPLFIPLNEDYVFYRAAPPPEVIALLFFVFSLAPIPDLRT